MRIIRTSPSTLSWMQIFHKALLQWFMCANVCMSHIPLWRNAHVNDDTVRPDIHIVNAYTKCVVRIVVDLLHRDAVCAQTMRISSPRRILNINMGDRIECSLNSTKVLVDRVSYLYLDRTHSRVCGWLAAATLQRPKHARPLIYVYIRAMCEIYDSVLPVSECLHVHIRTHTFT